MQTLRRVLRYIAVAIFFLEIQCPAQSAIKIGAIMERSVFTTCGMGFVSTDKTAESIPKVRETKILMGSLIKPVSVAKGSFDGYALARMHDFVHRARGEVWHVTDSTAPATQLRVLKYTPNGLAYRALFWQSNSLDSHLHMDILCRHAARESFNVWSDRWIADIWQKCKNGPLIANGLLSYQGCLLLNFTHSLLRRSGLLLRLPQSEVGESGIDGSGGEGEKSKYRERPLDPEVLPVAAILIGLAGSIGLIFLIGKIVYRMQYLFPLIFLGLLICFVLIGYGVSTILEHISE